MSTIPPYQMGDPQGGPPMKSTTNVWVWVLVGLAGMCVLCGAIGAAVLFPVFAQARQTARLSSSMSSAKQVSNSLALYTSDFDDRFPPMDSGANIVSAIHPYIKNSRLETSAMSYEWNLGLSRLDSKTIENQSALWLFVVPPPTGSKKQTVAFTDYHVRNYDVEEVSSVTAIKPIIAPPVK